MTETVWNLNIPREKADDKYLDMFFRCRRNQSQRLMSLKVLQDRSITDSTNALISLIDRTDKQEELWQFHQKTVDEIIAKYRADNGISEDEVLSDEIYRRLENAASRQTSARITEWFSQFWSISQSVEITFVHGDNNV